MDSLHDNLDDPRLTRAGFVRLSLATAGALAAGGLGAPARASASDLDGFIALSELVTGSTHLPVRHARRYLDALDRAGLPLAPSRLVRLAGFADGDGPRTLAALERSDAFGRHGARQAAGAVAAAWWSGMVPVEGGGEHVVTYEDALVWKALPYAEPPSLCLGATTAWSVPGRRLA